VFGLGAFLAWSMWDAAIGCVALLTGLVLLEGRPRTTVAAAAVLGVAAIALALDLFARDAGGSLFGELDGWQGSDADGVSSLVPVWALLVMGILLIAASIWCRRSFEHMRSSLETASTRMH